MSSNPPSPDGPTSEGGAEAAAAFGRLGMIIHGERPLTQTLQRVAELARQTIPELSDVSVTLVRDDRPRTVVFTSSLAVDLDERQYANGSGPCTDASASGSTILVDTATDTSYPDFAAAANRRGITYVLSVGLPIPGRIVGGLNMYSDAVSPFSAESVDIAETFAGYAAVAVANAGRYDDSVELVADMRAAMASRAVIEQAKGIIVAREHCSVEEAFALLTRISQRSNAKLRDVATQIVSRAADGSR